MHEFTITSHLVAAVLDYACKQNAKRVLEVQIRIGKLRALSVEQVKFAYGVLVKGTILDGSRLFVEEGAGIVRCLVCGYRRDWNADDAPTYHFGLPPLPCPQCGNSLNVEGGDECVVHRLRMEIP